MKKLIILSTITILFLSCSLNKKPKFIGLGNIKMLESTSKHITFSTDAKFKNPNFIGGSIQTDEIKVYINNNEMASVSTEKFNVPAKKEFTIPLKTKIPTDSILSNKNLSGFLGSLFTNKVKVQFKGDIKYKVWGFSRTYSVDQTEDIKIKY